MRYNIPARTLRDWMKRLNIKSVFTHNHSTSSSSASSNQNQNEASSKSSNPADSSKNLAKNGVTVTSVQAIEPTFTITDMKKLKSANSSEHEGGNTNNSNNSSSKVDEIGSVVVKIEDPDDNATGSSTKEVNVWKLIRLMCL